jgi:hypothetical protein
MTPSRFRTAFGVVLTRQELITAEHSPSGKPLFIWRAGSLYMADRDGHPVDLKLRPVSGSFCPEEGEAEPEPELEGEPQLQWVALYFTQRVFGGPEEGGWYYNRHIRVDDAELLKIAGVLPRAFLPGGADGRPEDDDALFDHLSEMVQALEKSRLNEDRPELTSAASNGRYTVEIVEGPVPPGRLPVRTPEYE